jgi:phytoene dehydrogenase-like protein
MNKHPDVVIGGGLGGLTAATLLARAGRKVVVFEKSSTLGGRGATQDEDGVRLNLGPHALYRAGAARATLRELGIEPAGGVPRASGSLALDRGRLHALPVGFASILSTGLLSFGEKLEAARFLSRIGGIDPASLRGKTVVEWIDAAVRRPGTRKLLHALVRVATYTNAPDLASAEAVVLQLQRAFDASVLYIDGGWQTLVEGLRARAVEAGVDIRTAARVVSVEPGRVKLAGGTTLDARSIVIAASPSAARSLVPSSATIARWERDAVPVRAACLDLALAWLPRPRATFCLGIDEPLYFSVHTAAAKLAPEGTQVIHVARYLAPGEEADASSLEDLIDRMQPGWRDLVVTRRFLPQLVVTHDVAPAHRPRASVTVDDTAGVFLVGDWVGDEGMLADTAFASARTAVSCILADLARGSARTVSCTIAEGAT